MKVVKKALMRLDYFGFFTTYYPHQVAYERQVKWKKRMRFVAEWIIPPLVAIAFTATVTPWLLKWLLTLLSGQ